MLRSTGRNVREVPAKDWVAFLREFNGRNYARPVRLQVSVPSDEAEPLLAENQPLIGVELDPKGSKAMSITVALGGLEAAMPEFTHVITRPTRLGVEEVPRGRTRRLVIESRGGDQTNLIFEPAESFLENEPRLLTDELCDLIKHTAAIGVDSCVPASSAARPCAGVLSSRGHADASRNNRF
jgi:hypothetical protein